jgi:hypothetical protein|tara:strand:- start:270 stop:506 length:237 start_codon:yes stop_codon:yes gene_type:complete
MKAFFERLGLIIHWIFFLATLVVFYLWWSDDAFFEGIGITKWWQMLLASFFPNSIGWVIRYLLSGKNNFFPFGDDEWV